MAAIVAVHSRLKFPLSVSLKTDADGAPTMDVLRLLPGRNEPDGKTFTWEAWQLARENELVARYLDEGEIFELTSERDKALKERSKRRTR